MKRLIAAAAVIGLLFTPAFSVRADGTGRSGRTDPPPGGVILSKDSGPVTLEAAVPKDGIYCPELSWQSIPKQTEKYIIDIQCDSGQPTTVQLPKLWQDDGDVYKDRLGNEFAPRQTEKIGWQQRLLFEDGKGYTVPLSFSLSAGSHTLTLTARGGAVEIGEVRLVPFREPPAYESYRQTVGSEKAYTGPTLVTEGEAASLKSDSFIVALSDNNTSSAQPYSARCGRLNYIGGSNWKYLGDRVEWQITAPETGWYKIAFHYRQNYKTDSVSFRSLRLDGEIPYDDCAALAFPYGTGWEYMTLPGDNGGDGLLYLTAGEHTLSLTVCMGTMDALSGRLEQTAYQLNGIYRDIRRITGENPDRNRDYALYRQIPDLEERLAAVRQDIERLSEETDRLTHGSGGGTAALRRVAVVIDKMNEAKYKAHRRLSAFNDAVSSLSAWLFEMREMPLDIDAILLCAPASPVERPEKAGFFTWLGFKLERILVSFFTDYSVVSSSEGERSIDVWANWGNDQIKTLSLLTESDFTAKTGIAVNIRITGANMIQANLSGRAPDAVLGVTRTTPVNYAMRGALYPLSDFEDFGGVKARFASMATVPYTYKNKVYGLPNTQNFYMLFYRTDIFEQLGLQAPATWDDFRQVSDILRLRGMQTGIPYTPITDMYLTDNGVGSLSLFPTLAAQRGASLYNDTLTGVDFGRREVKDAFREMMAYYSNREFPVSYDVFNRFRSGMMPMTVQAYTLYPTLAAAAPEIRGKWEMVGIPGTRQPDGSINGCHIGSGDACVIMGNARDPEAAWEYLKWWTDEETQYQFTKRVESAAGAAARHPSANVGAIRRMTWTDRERAEIDRQLELLQELPELPGGYFVSRAVDQIYWNVVNSSASVDYLLRDWEEIINEEIERKTAEYSDTGP